MIARILKAFLLLPLVFLAGTLGAGLLPLLLLGLLIIAMLRLAKVV